MKALLLVGWDNLKGSIIEMKYPNTYAIDDMEITKYLISIQSIASSSLLELRDENGAALIYGIQINEKMESIPIYDYILLILDKNDFPEIEYYQIILKKYGSNIIKSNKSQRKIIFQELQERIFHPDIKKIVFIGYPNAGKTTTKRFIFDHINEKELLSSTIEPTIGYESNLFNYLDLHINLFDTSGQELEIWFNENRFILHESDLIIFFFSISDWKENSLDIKKHLEYLSKFQKNNNIEPFNIMIFCHKVDLLEENQEELKNIIINVVKPYHFQLFYTSIKTGWNQGLYSALQYIINQNSIIIKSCLEQFQYWIESNILCPILLMDKFTHIIGQFQHNLNNSNKMGQIIKICTRIQNIFTVEEKSPEYYIFSYDLDCKNLICINLQPNFKDLSTVCFQINDYSNLKELFEFIHKFKINSTWIKMKSFSAFGEYKNKI